MAKGILYMIPSFLAESKVEEILPADVIGGIVGLRNFIVENERTSRRFLIKLGMKKYLDEIHFELLNKHTKPEELDLMLRPLLDGVSVGLISEAGCPGVADPGAEIAARAHKNNIRVIPYTGPSSILLALMASGLNGQQFAFHGYLPVQPGARVSKIRELQDLSGKNKVTQIFIETPYRNNKLLADLLSSLRPSTRLCVAVNITGPEEKIITKTIAEWKKIRIDLHKQPAVFLFLA